MKHGETLGVQSTPTIYINGRAGDRRAAVRGVPEVIDEELARKK